MKLISGFMLFALLLVTIGAVYAGSPWTPPPAETRPVSLPKLSRLLNVDGDLREWGKAASAPVRSPSYVLRIIKPHVWNGPADAGMEVYLAWTGRGLALAADVTDDDVRNDRPDAKLWEQDCVEFFVDGRVPGKLMQSPYSAGAYQITVRPPLQDKPAHAVVNERDGRIENLQVAGKLTASGYTIEMLIPWEAFPDITPQAGTSVGIQFAVDDYDARDGKIVQPLALSCFAAQNLWNSPQNFIRWTLADTPARGRDQFLGPMVSIDVPRIFVTEKRADPIRVELSQRLCETADRVQIAVKDANGVSLLDSTVQLSGCEPPWDASCYSMATWPVKVSRMGYHTVTVTVYDKSGSPLGTTERLVMFVGDAVSQFTGRIAEVDLKAMCAADPFRANAYTGAAAAIERLKRGIETRDNRSIIHSAREVEARLSVLRGDRVEPDAATLFDLLNLTTDPESQVVVEYPERDSASVTIYWGAIPLAQADVRLPGEGASGRSVNVRCPSVSSAEMLKKMILRGSAISQSEVDALRVEVLKAMKVDGNAQSSTLPLYCGDVHMHSCYSDGLVSTTGLVLQAMYCFMDFAVVTDHNTIEGAQTVRKLMAENGCKFPVTVGEEITMEWSHMNAYPLKEPIPETLSCEEIVKAAHAQGAVVQWNHPHAVDSDWMRKHIATGLTGTGLDAWEHIPGDYEAWNRAGVLPALTGSTDTHNGHFSDIERTVILSSGCEGKDIADAVRSGWSAILTLKGDRYVYGNSALSSSVYRALSDGPRYKALVKERLSSSLRGTNLAGMIEATGPKPESP